MTPSRTDELLAILQMHFNPREEGWAWLALYRDDRDGGVVNQIEGHYKDALATARALARMTSDSMADGAFVALCRAGGRPTESDRKLWRELRELLDASLLADMVVFDRLRAWSMRAEDRAAA